MFPRIRIVLVQTHHPGNIGSAARAMKTMGLERLYLVNPTEFPHPEATRLAAGATDLLDRAVVCDSLQQAVADCSLVVGASARLRQLALGNLDPEGCGRQLIKESQQQQEVALVFGRERSGLHNEELACCTHQVSIDGNPEYNILNLAQAVQLLCYEIFRAGRQPTPAAENTTIYPSLEAVQGFEAHLEQALRASGFLNGASDHGLKALQTLFRRARPDQRELGMLRSLVSRLEHQGRFYYQHNKDADS
ncbi:RNA methyltransferase [Marinospirillum alkaliphilum]|uniref:tRNA (cytidine/uridine-2'-O-)-methyltransferase TrmJ n=1 Tax=Marinospirillum alkaliphilum DSM 21637 TaxID=1122209 RepID=A0A1K1Z0W5_9GAMM|nr:RNA methyltransferase [Marinospirillum alkaliphilum]SFX67300.1 tRNA (cytidine32/uridine32-2'-O)-methyltransferase [Marinospirillum alkaliphilum DSM 21637]